VKTTLRRRAAAETTALPTIYRQETAALATNSTAAALMPAYSSVATTMLRERNATLPPLPPSRRDIAIPHQLQVTQAGEQFLLEHGHNGDYLIFATADNLRRLCQADLVSMDGTFSTVPNMFRQLFTLHAFENGHLLPLVYVLMAKKTSTMYQTVFASLKTHCQQLGLTFAPTEVLSDYESGLIAAVRSALPNSRHRGCLFHYSQVLLQLHFVCRCCSLLDLRHFKIKFMNIIVGQIS
jgi:hypothetical protein